MQRPLYISESRIKQSDAQVVASQIVDLAQSRNALLGITGALIFTNKHFAQALEGPPEAIQMLMTSIRRDPRHKNVVVIEEALIAQRQFPDWQMAYQGPSQFVSRHVERLLQPSFRSEQRRAAEWLTKLALAFSTWRSPAA